MVQLSRVQNIGWPNLTEFKIFTEYQLLEKEAVQLVACSAAYPAIVLLTNSHLGRVQNIGWSSLTEFIIFDGPA
jgi:hypothetical protein